MNREQEYWNILNSTQEGIKYSDTKATIILTLYGVVLTIIYTTAQQFLIALQSSIRVFWLSLISSLFATFSVLFAFLCLPPRVKNANAHSLLYFGHIHDKFTSYQDYRDKAEEILSNNDAYSLELTEQIHSNSIRAWKKFSNVSWCIRLLFGSIIFMLLALITYLFL